MIQRFLYDVLKQGFEAIEADPTLIDDLFAGSFELDATEVSGIKQQLIDNPVSVVHGYARTNHTFPLIAITLGNEGEDIHFLGDDVGIVQDTLDPDFGADIKSTIWQHHYNLHVYTEHPDVTTYVYETAKFVLLLNDAFLSDKGLFDVHITGADLAPDPRYIPEHLFARQMMFRCKREFCTVDKDSKLGKAFKIGSVHVNNPDTAGDIIGVPNPMVDPYTVITG